MDKYFARIEELLENLKLLPEIKALLESRTTDVILPAVGKVTAQAVKATEKEFQPAQFVEAEVQKPRQAENSADVKVVMHETSTPVIDENSPDYATVFAELQELVKSDSWPIAVDPDLICDDGSEDEKMMRAEGVIEHMIDEDIEGKKLLDFGCFQGHVTKKSLEQNPELSIGYDIQEYDWNNAPNFTTKWETIVEKGPYDIVLLYDVLDHLEGDHVTILKQIGGVMKPGGRFYIRCHPFCSRHGTHLYKTINKAYMHLVFSEVELTRMGYGVGLKTTRVIHPHATYKHWFNEAGLDLLHENAVHENLEEIFHLNLEINKRIRENWRNTTVDRDLSQGKGFPSFQMRLQFIDYILKVG